MADELTQSAGADAASTPATARPVRAVIPTVRTVEGGGFVVRRPFPTRSLEMLDPFLLLDHLGPVDYAPGEAIGAPDHPHRGFETVTYVLEGQTFHEDSTGRNGTIGPGDVQWMTAGAGVVHSEMPSPAIQRNGGRVHGFQLWVNLPAADKMIPPRYQEFSADRIAVLHPGEGSEVRVVAGDIRVIGPTGEPTASATGPVETHRPVTYAHVRLTPGTTLELDAGALETLAVYVVDGTVGVGRDDRPVSGGHLAILGAAAGTVVLHAHTAGAVGPVGAAADDLAEPAADVLVLGGTPLREPVARYGPFVMTTRAELQQAVDDYQHGRLGSIRR